MPTYHTREAICGCCGDKIKIAILSNPNCLGHSDLDSRPAPMKRWTMKFWVQSCPHCGYANLNVEKTFDGIKDIVNSENYKNYNNISAKSPLARAFIRCAMSCSACGDLEGGMCAYLHAAWACDDYKDNDAALKLREICELRLYELMKTYIKPEYYLIDADLLRRSGQFDKVIERYSSVHVYDDNNMMKKALAFEVEKAKEKDMGGYQFTDNGFTSI